MPPEQTSNGVILRLVRDVLDPYMQRIDRLADAVEKINERCSIRGEMLATQDAKLKRLTENSKTRENAWLMFVVRTLSASLVALLAVGLALYFSR